MLVEDGSSAFGFFPFTFSGTNAWTSGQISSSALPGNARIVLVAGSAAEGPWSAQLFRGESADGAVPGAVDASGMGAVVRSFTIEGPDAGVSTHVAAMIDRTSAPPSLWFASLGAWIEAGSGNYAAHAQLGLTPHTTQGSFTSLTPEMRGLGVNGAMREGARLAMEYDGVVDVGARIEGEEVLIPVDPTALGIQDDLGTFRTSGSSSPSVPPVPGLSMSVSHHVTRG
jgi:hypothetical protein